MLTRIRNAVVKRREVVEVPASKLKISISEILKKEGYIRDFHLADFRGQGKILINLRYTGKNAPIITGLRRISTPGRRVYLGYREIKQVFNGTGVGIYSTPKGIMTDQAAREAKVGGEHLLNIW